MIVLLLEIKAHTCKPSFVKGAFLCWVKELLSDKEVTPLRPDCLGTLLKDGFRDA
jgi:hypothetical protein